MKKGKRTLEDFNLNDAQKIANAIAYALGQQYPGVQFEMTAKEKTPPADQSVVCFTCRRFRRISIK